MIDFITKNITYLVGYQDTCNCNFGNCTTNNHECYYGFNGNNGTCDDNNLDTTCSAMLQGAYRYERMEHWIEYLKYYFGENNATLIKANVGHNYAGMMLSPQGLCVLYKYGCSNPGVLDAESITPGIYQFNDFLVGL